jgi:hypothetical protein
MKKAKRDRGEPALKVLRETYGPGFDLPKPSQFHSCITMPPAAAQFGKGRDAELIRRLAVAYALLILIDKSGVRERYKKALKSQHGKNAGPQSKLVSLILRSVVERSKRGPTDSGPATFYSSATNAILYLDRAAVMPHDVRRLGQKSGQGIAAWARRYRDLRKASRGDAVRKQPTLTEICESLGPSESALVEVVRHAPHSHRARVKRSLVLPKTATTEGGRRWTRISAAAKRTHAPSTSPAEPRTKKIRRFR